MHDQQILKDATLTIAECVSTLQQLAQMKKNFFSIDTKAPEMARILQNVIYLLQQGGPLLPQVKDEWQLLLSTAHGTNDRAFLMFLIESIMLGLKLYQHPEIGISLLTPNEDSGSDEEKDQG